ncbi:hypothetical protein RSAG8_13872, partial [Rhizoctonia solani AG-8 WAC10335]
MNYLEELDYNDKEDLIYRTLLCCSTMTIRLSSDSYGSDANKPQPTAAPETATVPPNASGAPANPHGQSIDHSREDRAYIHVLGIIALRPPRFGDVAPGLAAGVVGV